MMRNNKYLNKYCGGAGGASVASEQKHNQDLGRIHYVEAGTNIAMH